MYIYAPGECPRWMKSRRAAVEPVPTADGPGPIPSFASAKREILLHLKREGGADLEAHGSWPAAAVAPSRPGCLDDLPEGVCIPHLLGPPVPRGQDGSQGRRGRAPWPPESGPPLVHAAGQRVRPGGPRPSAREAPKRRGPYGGGPGRPRRFVRAARVQLPDPRGRRAVWGGVRGGERTVPSDPEGRGGHDAPRRRRRSRVPVPDPTETGGRAGVKPPEGFTTDWRRMVRGSYIAVDCDPATASLTLSHHLDGNGTPPPFRHDLASGAALNWAAG